MRTTTNYNTFPKINLDKVKMVPLVRPSEFKVMLLASLHVSPPVMNKIKEQVSKDLATVFVWTDRALHPPPSALGTMQSVHCILETYEYGSNQHLKLISICTGTAFIILLQVPL